MFMVLGREFTAGSGLVEVGHACANTLAPNFYTEDKGSTSEPMGLRDLCDGFHLMVVFIILQRSHDSHCVIFPRV